MNMMVVNVYQGVALINLDQVSAVEPLTTGGCSFQFTGGATRSITSTDDFASVIARLQAASVTFIP